MKTVEFEYGQGVMTAELPDSADIFVPGETVKDPPFIPQGRLVEETRRSIRDPIGMKPIAELVSAGSKVTIVFPDRVKGGFQENSHRKTSIPIVIEECLAAGVREEDIRLICSNGLHRKNTREEIRRILGDAVFDRFWDRHQIVNHDSEDWNNLVDLGCDELGDPVIMNKEVFESDLAVCIGHTLGNPYGGNILFANQLELIVPIPEQWQNKGRLSLFFDSGNVFSNDGTSFFELDEDGNVFKADYDFKFDDLRYSAGIAAEWLSPLGVFRFSYGFPLNDEEFDETENFQFSIGSAF